MSNDKEGVKLLLRAIVNMEDVNLGFEKLVEDSISELERGLDSLTKCEKESLVKFCFGLFEIKSASNSFHESRMMLLSVLIRNLNLKQLFELEFQEFDISKHLIHAVKLSTLDIRMYLEAQLINIEENKKKYNDEGSIKILISSFEIVDCLISGLNSDEVIEYLESSDKITGTYTIELVDSLRDIASRCIEFVLEIEDEIKKGLNENREKIKSEYISKLEISEESLRISGLYWTVYYCNLISSKWQIIEPNQELHKYIKQLEIVSKYLNSLHFALSFPTLVHIPVLDWGNANGILESIVTSLLSFCSLIGEKESQLRVSKSLKSQILRSDYDINGLYSGLYHASLLITLAWWSPGVDVYRHIKKGDVENGIGVEVEYSYRNYIEISDSLIKSCEFRVEANSDVKSIKYSLGIQPLGTNTIPEYTNLEEDVNTGVTKIRRIALTVFSEIIKIITGKFSINSIFNSEEFDLVLNSLENSESSNFEKASGIIQTFVCVFTFLTCRIPNSNIPEKMWRLLFLIVIRLTPKSTKGYYFDSGRKITIFISLLRSLGIAFCTGYSEYSEILDKLLEELKIETTYCVPKLIIKENCEEFSEEDEDAVRFFRDLIDSIN
ncbi:hypothetical protein FG386_002969 [Cryptosporidium ryanae]|uniref:uncharacterized protein n=1 Tax=Cryptosporidium ryanae TaxID=515981 RepID=UPI003519DBA9|nr:hypothetical protein FG386_002969 [Cryptosporidium ryanae]